jgi:hypothetical protein
MDNKRKRDYETGDAVIADFTKSLDAEAMGPPGGSGGGGGSRGGMNLPGPSAAGGGSGSAPKGQQAPYLPCKTFQGARAGYYFRLGTQGPGYYLDRVARHKAGRCTSSRIQCDPQRETAWFLHNPYVIS